MIERRIIIGLITSTAFLQLIRSVWDTKLLDSQMAKRLASWCIEYYDKYSKAPGKDIEGIYYQKLKEGLPEEIAEEIEQDILPKLSQEYEQEKFNLDYLLDQTRTYLKEKRLSQFAKEIEGLVEQGELTEAEKTALEYKPSSGGLGNELDLSNAEETRKRVDKAFDETQHSVVHYHGALGEFWNDQLVRGAFVAFMGIEKRGKTFWLMDIAIRAARQGAKVVFFQAGDMTEAQQIKRLCSYLTKKSRLKKYSGMMYEPIKDCVLNQRNTCDKEIRECDFGVFESRSEKEIRNETTDKELIKAYKDNPDYKACYNCLEYNHKSWGAVWLKKVDISFLSAKDGKEAIHAFFVNNKRKFKLATYIKSTLAIKEIKAVLSIWEKEDGFVPDLIVIDYADILVPNSTNIEFRHQQNEIWKAMGGLAQEKHCLLVTATQVDAKSYDQDRLKLSNFSEEKRKYGHVTAMYGLNQDRKGREKKLGMMVLNEIVIREGDFSNSTEVRVLQNLNKGNPCIGSFW